jgi:RHS repeat-associated protein
MTASDRRMTPAATSKNEAAHVGLGACLTILAVLLVAGLTLSSAAPTSSTAPTVAAKKSSSPKVSYTYDADGRLETVTTGGEIATYHYDAVGNLLSITRSSAGGKQTGNASASGATAPPDVSGVEPRDVNYGERITIAGHGFSANAAYDTVRVGDLFAHVVSASPTRLMITAPPGRGGSVEVETQAGQAKGPSVTIASSADNTSAVPAGKPKPVYELDAFSGVTALSGIVETNTGLPLAGVRLSIDNGWDPGQTSTTSNARGQFLLTDLSPGQHQLVIDGNDVAGTTRYGLYAEPVQLPEGRTTVLPWITYLTPLDTAHAVTIASPTTRNLVVTNPEIPGLEVDIPAGTVIRDYYGNIVHQVSITPIAIDRTPVPLAPGMPMFFTLQPGDASFSGAGFTVVYPNYTHKPSGAEVGYVAQNPSWEGTGWYRSGFGHVSADGSQITPDADLHYTHAYLLGYSNPLIPPPVAPPDCGCDPPPGNSAPGVGSPAAPPTNTQSGNDPVDTATGLYTLGATDLSLSDVEPAALTRSYRSLDDTIRSFGMGMSDDFDYYIYTLGDQNSATTYGLIEPDGTDIVYEPTDVTGVYAPVGTPTAFNDSTMDEIEHSPGVLEVNITLTDGTVYSFGDNDGLLESVTDRYGNSITITRTQAGNQGANEGPQTVTTSNGRWMHFTYGVCVPGSAPTYCVTQVTDDIGQTVSYSYDDFGRMTDFYDANGGKTIYSWATCSNPAAASPNPCTEITGVTDPNGYQSVANTYDPTTGRVTAQTQANGGTWQFSYTGPVNSSGDVTQTDVTDPLGTVDDYTFNANGYPASETDGVGTSIAEETTYDYDATTNLLDSTTDALGRTTSYSYDGEGNLISVTQLDGTSNASTTSYTYEPKYNRLTSITDPLGHTTSISYDDSAHTETITDAIGNKTLVHLNDEGLPIGVTDALGNTTYLSYLHDDLVAVTDPLGHVTSAYYDDLGRPLDVTDPVGDVTQYTWNPLDELLTTTDPTGGLTTATYDYDGNQLTLSDADGNVTNFKYNDMDELVTQTDPLHNLDTYTYDLLGNELTYTDGNGNESTFSYDALDRFTEAQYGVVGDTDQSSTTYSYDLANRLTQALDSVAGTYGFTYDGLDDVLSASSPKGTVSYTYYTAGLRETMTVPNQAQTNYTYEDDEVLTGITQGTSSVAFKYDADLRPTKTTLPDGVVESSKYNSGSQLTKLNYADGSTSLGKLTYSYDADSDITGISGSLARTNLPAAVTNKYNADNELYTSGSATLHYDNDGNLTNDGTNTYTWNDRGELSGISGPTTNASYTYDPFDRQASDTINGTTTSSLYDGANLVQQLSGSTPTANYLTGGLDQTFQVSNSAGTFSLLTDQLGSTIGLANSSGQITTSYTYDPYGAVTTSGAANPNPIQYAGTQNEETGLDLMGARYYSPTENSFISQDPIGFAGGQTDLYGYVWDDPVNGTDPSGLGKAGGSNSTKVPYRHPRKRPVTKPCPKKPPPRNHGDRGRWGWLIPTGWGFQVGAGVSGGPTFNPGSFDASGYGFGVALGVGFTVNWTYFSYGPGEPNFGK